MYICKKKNQPDLELSKMLSGEIEEERQDCDMCVHYQPQRKKRAAGKNMLVKTGHYICHQMVASINQALLLWGGGK